LDTVTQAPVALKVLPVALSADSDEATRFRKALVPVAHLSHPHLQALRHLHEAWEIDDLARAETGVSEGAQVLVTDLLDGEDLGAYREARSPQRLNWDETTALLSSVAGALSTVHDAGLIHGMVSPSNVMMCPSGAVLLDLGVARELRVSLARLGEIDLTAALSAYAAPEQHTRQEPGPAADQFALAALCVDCLTGAFDHLSIGVLPVPALSTEQNAVLKKALASDPEDRFPSCTAFTTALFSAREDTRRSTLPQTAAEAADQPVADGQSTPGPALLRPLPAGPDVDDAPSAAVGRGVRSDATLVPDTDPERAQNTADPGQALKSSRGGRQSYALEDSEETLVSASPPRTLQEFEEEPAPAAGRDVPLPSVVRQASLSPAARLLNWAIALSIVALLALAAAAVYLRVLKQDEVAPTIPLAELENRERLSRTFAYTATFSGEPAASEHLQLRLLGQVSALTVSLENGTVTVSRRAGRDDRTVLGRGALPASPREGDRLVVVKEPAGIGAFFNDVCIASGPCAPQEWRVAKWEATQAEGMPVSFSFQKIGPLVFADDFMHGEDEFGEWEPVSGDWSVHALQNPVRSANPFSFFGKGEDALAVAGRWFWRNYRLTCAVHPLAGSAFGLKFCRRDEGNSYDVLWTQGEQGEAVLALRRIAGGETTVLGRKTVHFLPKFWVELAVEQLDGMIRVYVDGRQELTALDPNPLLGGTVGLWSRGGEGTVFDDVEVAPTSAMRFDLKRPDATPNSVIQGLPKDAAAYTDDGMRAGARMPVALTVAGIVMKNAALTARLSGLNAWEGQIDLGVRQVGSEQALLRLENNAGQWSAVLVQERADGQTELARQQLEKLPDRAEIACRVIGSEIWGTVNGTIVALAGNVTTADQGLASLTIRTDKGSAVVHTLGIEPETPLEPIENRVETFTHEESMDNWNSPVLEWTIQYGAPWPLYWHRSDFWEDVTVSMDLAPLLTRDASDAWGLALGAPNDADDKVAIKARLTFDPPSHTVTLDVDGQEPQTMTAERGVRELALTRRDGRILAHVNQALAWDVALPDALRGLCSAGRIGRGSTVPWAEAVSILASGVRTYSFKRAPTAWIPASGTWEVTNRWQCDPRWSFFSGVKRQGVACIWNKGRHGDDVTVEFFAGPKMDQDRGRKYEYAANLNAVICSDGVDITSGYSFMFGGWDDRGSQIVRGKDILKENRQMTIPRHSSTHRRWFHVKIRKHGSTLTYWIDGARVASVEEAQPLSGDRFGIWTWDNGMMVAQLRVSTTTDLPAAPLGQTAPRAPKTPYD
jgi:serine/threonine protein kinase